MKVHVIILSENEVKKDNLFNVYHLSKVIFSVKFNYFLVKQVLQTILVNSKKRCSAQKSRSQIRGGGIKPWRQKGTGRARAGSIRSPLWRGGARIFASTGIFKKKKKINKKMRRSVLCSVLSELLYQDRVFFVDGIYVSDCKVRSFLSLIKGKFDIVRKKVYILVDIIDLNLYTSTRNLNNIFVSSVSNINLIKLVSCEFVIFTIPAVRLLEKLFYVE